MRKIGILNGVTGRMGRTQRHAASDEPFRWVLLESAKGIQLAELGYEAARDRSCVDVPTLQPEGAS